MTSSDRRQLLKMIAAAPLLARLASASDSIAQTTLPAEVAGVRLPRSELALAALAFAQQNCPDFLFNHCMRTFTFGALSLQRQRRSFNVDTAFVASALHDLGLLQAFESARGSFEIDGADAAEKFMLGHHRSAAEADRVWHAVELHDLPEADAAAFMRDARGVSRALAAATGAVKLNYEIHGNTLPHLHMHFFPRYRGDQFEGRPIDPRHAAQPVYAPGEFAQIRDAFLLALNSSTA